MSPTPLQELLLQALETEEGTVSAYDAAIPHAMSPGMREQWRAARLQACTDRDLIAGLAADLGVATRESTPGQRLVRAHCTGVVRNILVAGVEGKAFAEACAAQALVDLLARGCLNWDLLIELTATAEAPGCAAIHARISATLGEKRQQYEAASANFHEIWRRQVVTRVVSAGGTSANVAIA